jgi:hypothetical protein
LGADAGSRTGFRPSLASLIRRPNRAGIAEQSRSSLVGVSRLDLFLRNASLSTVEFAALPFRAVDRPIARVGRLLHRHLSSRDSFEARPLVRLWHPVRVIDDENVDLRRTVALQSQAHLLPNCFGN